MIKYGIHLFLWTENFDENSIHLIKKAKIMGFDGVEIPLLNIDQLNVGKITQALQENDMGCTGSTALNVNQDITSDDENVRRRGIDYLKNCVRVVSELGGDVLSGVLYIAWGKIVGRGRTEQEWDRSINCLREVCNYAKNYNITLAVEPVNRFETYFINTAADAINFVKDVGEPNIKIHLDTFHMNIEEKDFYHPFVEAYDLLYHVHCCENDRGVVGTGNIIWNDVFKALSEIGYDRWIVLESFVPEMKNIAATTAIWRQIAPSADAIASEGLKFLKNLEKKYYINE